MGKRFAIAVLIVLNVSTGLFYGDSFYVAGDEFVWQAPLRTRRLPLGWVRHAWFQGGGSRGWIGTTRGRLCVVGGRRELDEAFLRLSQTAHFRYQP